jgi:hypothetical protein
MQFGTINKFAGQVSNTVRHSPLAHLLNSVLGGRKVQAADTASNRSTIQDIHRPESFFYTAL